MILLSAWSKEILVISVKKLLPNKPGQVRIKYLWKNQPCISHRVHAGINRESIVLLNILTRVELIAMFWVNFVFFWDKFCYCFNYFNHNLKMSVKSHYVPVIDYFHMFCSPRTLFYWKYFLVWRLMMMNINFNKEMIICYMNKM